MDFTLKKDLFKACKDGDLETVSKLLPPENVNLRWGLEKSEAKERGLKDREIRIYPPGCAVHIQYNAETTLLHVAAAAGKEKLAELLLQKGSDIKARDGLNSTPLHLASTTGAAGVVKLLIRYGADVLAQDNLGRSPLHCCAFYKGGTEVAEFLIEKGGDVSGSAKIGRTPLHIASQEGNVEVAQLLISRGADVHEEDNEGVIPLHLAGGSKEGGTKVAEMLLEKDSDVNRRCKLGRTPLHRASDCGNAKVAQLLISHGADIHAKDEEGSTPLHWAGYSKDGGSEVAEILLEKGCAANLKDKEGRTPLHFASIFGNAKVAQLLLSHGADIHAKRNDGGTPLHCAGCEKDGGAEVVEILLRSGSDVSGKDNAGMTPLDYAKEYDKVKGVEMLVNHRAEIDSNGTTPSHPALKGKAMDSNLKLKLFEACKEGAIGTLKEMLPVDDINVTWDQKEDGMMFQNGDTPLHVASGYEVVEIIIKNGGDVKARDNNGKTPLDHAIKSRNFQVSRLLIQHVAEHDDAILHHLELAAMEKKVLFWACQRGDVQTLKSPLLKPYVNITWDEDKDGSEFWLGDTPLHVAARLGQKKAIEALLQQGADIHKTNGIQQTALHLATEMGKTDVMEVLIDHGCHVDAGDKDLCTALHLAVKEGNLAAVALLIKHEANIQARDKNNHTPLHQASELGRPAVIADLIQHGANANSKVDHGRSPLHLASIKGNINAVVTLVNGWARINVGDTDGCTPLHLAVKYVSQEVKRVAATLISLGADVGAKDSAGRTPLHLASQEENVSAVEILLELGADIQARDSKGNSPLHLAGAGDVVSCLMRHGAKVDSRNNKMMTPLHSACLRGNISAARGLLECGAEVDSKACLTHTAVAGGIMKHAKRYNEELLDNYLDNYHGQTPLHVACYGGHHNIVDLLLKHSADISASDSGNNSVLHFVAESTVNKDNDHERQTIVETLLKKNADLHARDTKGATPLHRASDRGNVQLARLLISKGAEVNTTDNRGRTPLHCACSRGHLGVVRLLLERDARVNMVDAAGRAPMHDACRIGHLKIVQVLIDNGAELIVADNKEYTPLAHAASVGCIDVCETLLQHGGNSRISDIVLAVHTGVNVKGIVMKIKQKSLQSPLQTWEDEGVRCESKEKLITRAGGKIELPNVTLYVPPNALTKSEVLSVTQRHNFLVQQQQITDTGLQEILQPGMQLELKPHGFKFLRPVQLKNMELGKDTKLLVFHNGKGINGETPWTDVTSNSDTKCVSIDHFGGIEILLLRTVDVVVDTGKLIQYATSLMNKCYAVCNFYVFYKRDKESLEVIAKAQSNEGTEELSSFSKPDAILYGEGVSYFHLTDKEALHFYNGVPCHEATGFTLDLEQCRRENWQSFDIPMPKLKVEALPEEIDIRRPKFLGKTNVCQVEKNRDFMERYKYRWAGQELSDKGCTSDRLQKLLSGITMQPDGNSMKKYTSVSYMKEVHWVEVWENLWRIRNAKCIGPVMDILRILVHDEAAAQHAWTSIMKYSGGYVITLTVMEILCLCAEMKAQPTKEDLQKILEKTNVMTKNEEITLYHITRSDEITLTFLKALFAFCNKHFICDLQFLADLYVVSQKMLKLGRRFVHESYGTMEDCLESKKLIDIFLFISNKQEESEIPIENLLCKNWLQRNPLHLAAIILDSEKALNCLPNNVVETYLNAKDLHGCTPLHLAHLHHNDQAVQFLISHGADRNVTDKFGMNPKSLERTTEDHPDVKYKKVCCSVLEVNCGVLDQLKPMLVQSEDAANALSDEVKILFEHLVRGTRLENVKIIIAGSMREKLKAGRLDEVDVILKFEGEVFNKKELLICLMDHLAEISWETDSEERIDLRPISVHGPWKFLREGMTVSLDVVVVFVDEGEQKYEYGLQGELLMEEERSLHRKMVYFTLETWNNKGNFSFKPTNYACEWDMIDSLPASCRLAIVIAKALVQAYDLCRGDGLRVKTTVTSYMIKTAMFYILAYNYSGQLPVDDQDLRDALEHVEGDRYNSKIRPNKLKYNPQPKWLTKEDVDQDGEEARLKSWEIFTLIKYLAQKKKKLKSYWDRDFPAVGIGDYGEVECILDVCDCALERLSPETFFKDNGP